MDKVFKDPFDFDNKEPSAEDLISTKMNDDGEIEFSIKESEDNEDKTPVESSETEGSIEAPRIDYPEGLVQTTDNEELKELKTTNQKLLEEVNKLKGRFTKEDSKKEYLTKREKLKEKLKDSVLSEDEQDAIIEVALGEYKEPEIEEPSEELSEDEKIKRQIQYLRETSKVTEKYDGEDGRPNIMQMKPYVSYLQQHFGKELGNIPMPGIFRVAENVPFIQYLEQAYPDKMNELKDSSGKYKDIKRLFEVSEVTRRLYYKQQKKEDSLEHLIPSTKKENNSNEETTSTLSNEEVKRLMGEKKELESRSVPGGEVETEEDIRKKNKPKTAREAVISAFD